MYQLTKDNNGAIRKFEAPRDIAPTPAAKLESTTTLAAWSVADLSASTSSYKLISSLQALIILLTYWEFIFSLYHIIATKIYEIPA